MSDLEFVTREQLAQAEERRDFKAVKALLRQLGKLQECEEVANAALELASRNELANTPVGR